jgi:hypothetical protein
MHEIEIVKAVLDGHGIQSVSVNKTDSIYPSNGAIELYVMKEDALKARHFISSGMK